MSFADQTSGPSGGYAGLAGLLERYDPLLSDHAGKIDETGRAELQNLSRVFDLGVTDDTSAPDIWRALRSALVKRLPTTSVEEAKGPPTDPAKPLTIMVVEDDEDTARMLVEGLTERGHGVVGPIATAEAASIVAGFHTIDIALLDINLDGRDSGADLARKLMADWNVPTIFLSGDVAQSAQNADVALGYILKPYRIHDVVNALERVLD